MEVSYYTSEFFHSYKPALPFILNHAGTHLATIIYIDRTNDSVKSGGTITHLHTSKWPPPHSVDQWRSQGLLGWASCPPGRPKWEENEAKLRKNERSCRKMRKDWGNHPILPAQEWEASHGSGVDTGLEFISLWKNLVSLVPHIRVFTFHVEISSQLIFIFLSICCIKASAM